jgi:hypothetical protein
MSVLEDPRSRANLTRQAIGGRLHPSVEVQLYREADGRLKVSFEIATERRSAVFIVPEGAEVASE